MSADQLTIYALAFSSQPLDAWFIGLHLFDLNLLVSLDALLTERNVTRAGNRLNFGQSALSGALARLRHSFHDELLVPVWRQMALTPVAEGLVEPVRDILLRIRETLGSKPQFEEPAGVTAHDRGRPVHRECP